MRSPARTRFSTAVRGPGQLAAHAHHAAGTGRRVLVDADRLRQARPVEARRPAGHEPRRRRRPGRRRRRRPVVTVVASTMCGPSGAPGRVMLVVWQTRSTRGPSAGAGVGVHQDRPAPVERRRAARRPPSPTTPARWAAAPPRPGRGAPAAAAPPGPRRPAPHAGPRGAVRRRCGPRRSAARRRRARGASTRTPSSTAPPAWRTAAEVHSAIIPRPSLGITDEPFASIASRKRK